MMLLLLLRAWPAASGALQGLLRWQQGGQAADKVQRLLPCCCLCRLLCHTLAHHMLRHGRDRLLHFLPGGATLPSLLLLLLGCRWPPDCRRWPRHDTDSQGGASHGVASPHLPAAAAAAAAGSCHLSSHLSRQLEQAAPLRWGGPSLCWRSKCRGPSAAAGPPAAATAAAGPNGRLLLSHVKLIQQSIKVPCRCLDGTAAPSTAGGCCWGCRGLQRGRRHGRLRRWFRRSCCRRRCCHCWGGLPPGQDAHCRAGACTATCGSSRLLLPHRLCQSALQLSY